MNRTPFVYPPEGSMILSGDGPELFAHGGVNDAPMWKVFCQGIVVGVGATRNDAFSVEADGRFTSWRGFDGVKADETFIEEPGVFGMVTASSGISAILAKKAAIVGTPRAPGRTIPFPALAAAAFGPEEALALGSKSGAFEVFDKTGKSVGKCTLGAAITGIAWRAPGQWAVAAGTKVTLVDATGAVPALAVDLQGTVGPVAVSGDGALFAVVVGSQQVAIGEFGQNKVLGTITVQRDISGVGFGAGAWLAIGYDEAEANRVDLTTGQMCRTEAHPGRTAGRWVLKVEVDPMLVRQAVTKVRAGGKAVATHIIRGEDAESGGGCLRAFLITMLLILICSGCAGFSGAGYYFYYYVYTA